MRSVSSLLCDNNTCVHVGTGQHEDVEVEGDAKVASESDVLPSASDCFLTVGGADEKGIDSPSEGVPS